MIVLVVSILIIVGLILMVAGFVLPARDDLYDSDRVDAEIREMVRRNVNGSKRQVQEMVDTVIGDNIGQTTRAIERITNEKIQSISDYSDTVINEIHKSHDEVTFMYEMLDAKHKDLKKTSAEVTKVAKEAADTARDAKISAEETYGKAKNKLDEAVLTVQQIEEAKRTELAKELASIKAYAKQSAQDRLEMERSLAETRNAQAMQQMAMQQQMEARRQAEEAAMAAQIEQQLKMEQQLEYERRERERIAQVQQMEVDASLQARSIEIQRQKTSAPAPVPASRHEIPETVYIDGQPLPQHEVSKEVRTAVDNSVSIDGQRGTISEIVAKNDRKMPESFTKMMQPETYDSGVWFGDVEPTSAMRRAAMERLRSEEEERQKRMKKNFKPMADRGMKQIDVSRSHVIGVKDESKNKVVPISQGGKGGNAYRELLLAGKDPSDLSLNDHILLMHHQGKSNMAIARELGLGIGEVTLVIELSKKQRVVKDNNG